MSKDDGSQIIFEPYNLDNSLVTVGLGILFLFLFLTMLFSYFLLCLDFQQITALRKQEECWHRIGSFLAVRAGCADEGGGRAAVRLPHRPLRHP